LATRIFNCKEYIVVVNLIDLAYNKLPYIHLKIREWKTIFYKPTIIDNRICMATLGHDDDFKISMKALSAEFLLLAYLYGRLK
jgi:hypothetical protein